jgi:hypothetical protein
MRKIITIVSLLALGCTEPSQKEETVDIADANTNIITAPDTQSAEPKQTEGLGSAAEESAPTTVYENKRFKDVRIEKLGVSKYLIHGRGQIFEASFGWAVEDGHNELKQGHGMTDAGAPEWGNFRFTIDVQKKRPNSKLHIILFETSAKDGSRQHELPIPLQE